MKYTETDMHYRQPALNRVKRLLLQAHNSYALIDRAVS